MSDQARIETAIDTTIDNCEVLRARLAKYEDADGKPITTIAEQAREIELWKLWAQANWNEFAGVSKAQPSVVVLPGRKKQPDGFVTMPSHYEGWNACLDEVARLNPSRGVQEGFGITQEQIDRHTTTAWECPPQSLVVLVSSLKRLAEKNAAAPSAASQEQGE